MIDEDMIDMMWTCHVDMGTYDMYVHVTRHRQSSVTSHMRMSHG